MNSPPPKPPRTTTPSRTSPTLSSGSGPSARPSGLKRGTGIRFGGNLAEALSCALGLAAVDLDLDLDDAGNPEDADFAAGGLVRHRTGSWEAVHVRALVFPPDLIPHI
jgi:hypothetical protein